MAHERGPDKDFFYALARTSEEAERLHVQSVLWGEYTTQILDKLHLVEGMSCLDIGCGAGDVMIALGERVGLSGRVLGLDIDAELGSRVVKELIKKDISQFSFIEADITKPESLPSELFDVTTARFLLLHMPDPIATLRTIWSLTKPGGVMVVFDYDFRTHSSYPECSELNEFIKVVDGVFEKGGLDPRLGFKLPDYFERAEVGPPDGVDVSCFVKPVSDLRAFFLLSYRSLLPAALKLGVTTEERAEKLISFLEEFNEDNNAYWMSAQYYGIWKHKQ